jgi:hypothetical protein
MMRGSSAIVDECGELAKCRSMEERTQIELDTECFLNLPY